MIESLQHHFNNRLHLTLYVTPDEMWLDHGIRGEDGDIRPLNVEEMSTIIDTGKYLVVHASTAQQYTEYEAKEGQKGWPLAFLFLAIVNTERQTRPFTKSGTEYYPIKDVYTLYWDGSWALEFK